MLLTLQAYLLLIQFEFCLARGNFESLYSKVRNCRMRSGATQGRTVEQICAAVDIACIWYWKEALCLQRSATLTYLLKSFGLPARLVIGAQHLPFKAHAWVEVDGRVVNDKIYIPEQYVVLDRC